MKFHLSNIYRKLGVSNRTEASRFVHASSPARRPGPRLVPTPAMAAAPVTALSA